jgi:NTE family protein
MTIDRDMESCQTHRTSRKIENVLVLQGGGSLGAFSCGVFKALYNNGIRFDIVGGTSIGTVNAAIICGSKSGNPAKDLEDFWMEIAENSYRVIPDMYVPYYKGNQLAFRKISAAPMNAIMFGVPGFFVPRWQNVIAGHDTVGELPLEWTYYYDHSHLVRTLEKYVDFGKISKSPAAGGSPRMIATAVDVLTAEALVFDSAKTDIKPEHVLASSAYSAYGFPWIQVGENVYAWDGGLLSNTPLPEQHTTSRDNRSISEKR